MHQAQDHIVEAVHPVPDQPFAFRTYPRAAIVAAFDPDHRLTVGTSIPVDGQLALRPPASTIIGWEGFDADLVADTLGPIRLSDPSNDVLDHDAVVMLDDGVLRIFRAYCDSDPRRTGTYRVTEIRVPGRQRDVDTRTLTDRQRGRLVAWLGSCIEVAAARREGFMLLKAGHASGGSIGTIVSATHDRLEITRMGRDNNAEDLYPTLAEIPLRRGATHAAAEALLDDIANDGLTPLDVSPVFMPRWGDHPVVLEPHH